MKSELAAKFKLDDEKAIEAVRSFIESKLIRSENEYDYFQEVKTYEAIWIVSRFGRIIDNKLELISILFSDEGEVSVGSDAYYPVGEIARWSPDLVNAEFIYQLELAHERKIRQLEFYLQEARAKFSFRNF